MRAAELIGKRVLIDITTVDGEAVTQVQMVGTVAAVGATVTVDLEGSRQGEVFTLPPDLSAFHRAAPGRYTLRGSGETVDDPDVLVTYTVHAAPRP